MVERYTGEEMLLVLVRDVLEHMKQQNSQQRESIRVQKESNDRVVAANKRMMMAIIGGIVGILVIIWQGSVLNRSAENLKELTDRYTALQSRYESLESKISDKLRVTPQDIVEKVDSLERKVDTEVPKLRANERGQLQIEVQVAPKQPTGTKKAPTPSGSARAVFPIQRSTPVELK